MEREKVSHNQILIAFFFVIWRWAAAIQHALAPPMTILWQCNSVTSINHLVVPYRVPSVFADEFTSPRPPRFRAIGSWMHILFYRAISICAIPNVCVFVQFGGCPNGFTLGRPHVAFW